MRLLDPSAKRFLYLKLFCGRTKQAIDARYHAFGTIEGFLHNKPALPWDGLKEYQLTGALVDSFRMKGRYLIEDHLRAHGYHEFADILASRSAAVCQWLLSDDFLKVKVLVDNEILAPEIRRRPPLSPEKMKLLQMQNAKVIQEAEVAFRKKRNTKSLASDQLDEWGRAKPRVDGVEVSADRPSEGIVAVLPARR